MLLAAPSSSHAVPKVVVAAVAAVGEKAAVPKPAIAEKPALNSALTASKLCFLTRPLNDWI